MNFAIPTADPNPLRRAISDAYRRDEPACVQALVGAATLSDLQKSGAQALARQFVATVRAEGSPGSGVAALMHEFSLSSDEGIALMCVAEALLRIPDRATADRLIQDKLSAGDWETHLGRSTSLFVNAAAWGLLITGKLVTPTHTAGLAAGLTRLLARGGEPLIRRAFDLAMRLLGRQFVLAENIDEALERAEERSGRGYRYSFDMLGEAALTAADAARYYAAYEHAIHRVGAHAAGRGVHAAHGVSVKLSALHPRYARAQRERVLRELLPKLLALFALAQRYDIGLSIDAEEADRLELSLELIEAVASEKSLQGFQGIGIVVQAYQKRAPYVIDWLIDLARTHKHRFMVRLVKGAYWDSEIKRAQIDGASDYPVYTRKVHTDVAYLACARKLLDATDALFPQFATHNAYSVAAIHELAMHAAKGPADFEYQCLHGMGEQLYDAVQAEIGERGACRIYAPVGSHQSLLPYLVRRLLENGANSSFVHRLVDPRVSVDELVADPTETARKTGGRPHSQLPLPADLYGPGRLNSPGLDLSNENELAALDKDLRAWATHRWSAIPQSAHGAAKSVLNPAQEADIVGKVSEADAIFAGEAVTTADAYANAWTIVAPAERAEILLRAADLLSAERLPLIALLIREAGKTLPNANGEIRELIDACRYYAAQLMSHEHQHAPQAGPVVCISPWNFPLAIFGGQVCAALAAGYTVIAKPAEQTPLIAAYAVDLFHRAGVPEPALQTAFGAGNTVGEALVRDARVRGVLFTGSTRAAKNIEARLAERGCDLLIAETGGQNAMIVDSSALPEQVVKDVLLSAFDSAGQRCSALRVLYVQREIADEIWRMLCGAMDELRIGDPARLDTDIGPVIDASARDHLLAHISTFKSQGFRFHQCTLTDECANGNFVAPTLFEIDRIGRLKGEIFGPVLHFISFDWQDLGRCIDDINDTGFGLTHGIHSRINESVETIRNRIRAGNIYVNRSMIGAVVGVQPFGGEGLSGTGPKAGGPLYLRHLLRAHGKPPGSWHDNDVELPALDALKETLPRFGLPAEELRKLGALVEHERAITPLRRQLDLQGPTGESNRLYFAPRGIVGCSAPNILECLHQLVAAFSTGNRVVLDSRFEGVDLLRETLGDWILKSALDQTPVAALLYYGDHAEATQRRQELARAQPGIARALEADSAKRYDLYELVAERCVSADTTAAGGNASLMTLGDG